VRQILDKEREAQERDRPLATAAPFSTAARMIALQRTAGNHAVAAMLAREAKPKQVAPAPGLAILQGLGSIPLLSVQIGQGAPLPSHAEKAAAPPEVAIMAKQGDHSAMLERASRSGPAFEADVFIGEKIHLKLHKALVSSYRLDSSGDGPVESWVLNSESIEFVTDER
jgi:hypothetical protein